LDRSQRGFHQGVGDLQLGFLAISGLFTGVKGNLVGNAVFIGSGGEVEAKLGESQWVDRPAASTI